MITLIRQFQRKHNLPKSGIFILTQSDSKVISCVIAMLIKVQYFEEMFRTAFIIGRVPPVTKSLQ